MGEGESKSAEERYRELSQWGAEPELNDLDALMWRTERHPSFSWSGCVVELLDTAPAWEDYRRASELALEIVPRFKQRIVEPALPVGPPVWVDDEHFDLDYHVRRVELPGPGTERQLYEYAERLALTPLDYTRSPWVRTFIEGLEGGRAALILQAHHVIMDGMGYAQLMSRLYDSERRPEALVTDASPNGARPSWTPLSITLDHVADDVRATPKRALGLARGALGILRAPGHGARYVSSLTRVMRPPEASGAPLLHGGSRHEWRFGVFEAPLSDFKAAGKAAGGSVNDAFVATLLGGIRRYHERVGAVVGDVTVSMPVSMRTKDDPMGGNRFTGAFFATSAAIEDPAERIAAMRTRVEEIRGEPALDFINQLTPLLNRTPSAVVGAMLHGMDERADLTLSNWPGVPDPVYVAGARVDRVFVFGPLPGTAMTASLNSHNGICCIALNVDGEVFDDPEILWGAMDESLEEILALAPSEPAGAS